MKRKLKYQRLFPVLGLISESELLVMENVVKYCQMWQMWSNIVNIWKIYDKCGQILSIYGKYMANIWQMWSNIVNMLQCMYASSSSEKS